LRPALPLIVLARLLERQWREKAERELAEMLQASNSSYLPCASGGGGDKIAFAVCGDYQMLLFHLENGKALIPRDQISAVVDDDASVDLGPVPHPVCELFRPLRLQSVRRLCLVADERAGLAVTANQQQSVLQFALVVLHSTEWLKSLGSCLVELQVHGARELKVANLEHSDLSAEHCNAGGFTHDLPFALCRSSVRRLLADAETVGHRVALFNWNRRRF
jgi:hypothetical protein